MSSGTSRLTRTTTGGESGVRASEDIVAFVPERFSGHTDMENRKCAECGFALILYQDVSNVTAFDTPRAQADEDCRRRRFLVGLRVRACMVVVVLVVVVVMVVRGGHALVLAQCWEDGAPAAVCSPPLHRQLQDNDRGESGGRRGAR